MASLFSLNNKAIPIGKILTNHVIIFPVGVVALGYTVTVGVLPVDPTQAPPEDLTVWVDYQDAAGWHEASRFTTSSYAVSTGVLANQGTSMRISATCGIATVVSLSLVATDGFGQAT